MKVFISWSGDRSRQVAEALRDWLPNVVQTIEPWMSSRDIDAGARWAVELAAKLEETKFGVICLTPENLGAPWILFEAGALSKTVSQSFVCPYLFDLERVTLTGPLAQFQAMKAERDHTLKLLQTMNGAADSQALTIQRLEAAFEKWWPTLEQRLEGIVTSDDIQPTARRDAQDILEEILELVRNQFRWANTMIHNPYIYYNYNMPLLSTTATQSETRMMHEVLAEYILKHFKSTLNWTTSIF